MRDIERIDPIVYGMGEIWKQYFPDWRFMQFIVNFQTWRNCDSFYLEDDDLIEQVCEFVKAMGRV